MERRSFLTRTAVHSSPVLPSDACERAGPLLGTSPHRPLRWRGVPIVDSPIAVKTMKLVQETYPAYLLHHAMRTYLFGSLIGRAPVCGSTRRRSSLPA